MTSPLKSSPRPAGKDGGQVIADMPIAVAHPAAVQKDGMIQQVAIAVWRRPQFLEEVGEQFRMEDIDLEELIDLAHIVLMVRQRVVCFRNSDLVVRNASVRAGLMHLTNEMVQGRFEV